MNLYIHVPFCNGKCAYCAFYSEPRFSLPLWTAWRTRIEEELERVSEPVTTLYLGGGTPTLAPAGELEKLFRMLHRKLVFTENSERSIECNPETVTPEKAALLAEYFNRISMGAQTFSAKLLKRIGRTASDPDVIRSAFGELRRATGCRIGLDLIYALPGQTAEEFQADLQTVAELGPDHLSAYTLTLEEGTPLAGQPGLSIPSDEVAAEQWRMLEQFDPVRYPRYEVSNYAAAACECRHNQAVWHGEPYLGLGPSATSFDGVDRRTEVADLHRWLNGEPAEVDRIPRENRLREIFVMGLRTVRGWSPGEFETATGDSFDFLRPQLEKLAEGGLLDLSGGAIRPTAEGLLFWNDLALELI